MTTHVCDIGSHASVSIACVTCDECCIGPQRCILIYGAAYGSGEDIALCSKYCWPKMINKINEQLNGP